MIRYYRRLNQAKFIVIHNIETRLLEQPFTEEWSNLSPPEDPDAVTKRNILKRWKGKHKEASAVEQIVPWVFVGLYVVLGVGLMLR